MSGRRAVRPGETSTPRIERQPGDGAQVSTAWRIRSMLAARQVLRARHATTQAGFTAEKIPKGYLRHHPILVSDGPLHDEQRRKVARFLAPRVVEDRYLSLMEESAERLVAGALERGRCVLDELALLFTVEVTAEIVGLTESPVPRMARRLESFFRQPPVDVTRDDLGRTGRQWAQAAVRGLLPVARFWWYDVRPAVRVRRAAPRDDIVSHLVAEGYTDTDILVECVTYGTAGMVTTREFIVMAAWHLLRDESLRARYLAAQRDERLRLLNEIIRLEPVVGHLYRRAQQPVEIHDDLGDGGSGGPVCTVEPGDLIDVCIRSANADERVVGAQPLSLRPERELPSGVNPAGLAFGDGEHRCPGQPVALLETDVLLQRLLATEPRALSEPEVGWDDLIEGYQLRGLRLGW